MTCDVRDNTIRNYNIAVANILGVPVREIPELLKKNILGHRSGPQSDLPHHCHIQRAEAILEACERGESDEKLYENYIATWSSGSPLSPSQQEARIDALEGTGILPKEILKALRDALQDSLERQSELPHHLHVQRAKLILEAREQGESNEKLYEDYIATWSTGGRLSSSQQVKRIEALEKTDLLPEETIKAFRDALQETRSHLTIKERAKAILEARKQDEPIGNVFDEYIATTSGKSRISLSLQDERINALERTELLPEGIIKELQDALREKVGLTIEERAEAIIAAFTRGDDAEKVSENYIATTAGRGKRLSQSQQRDRLDLLEKEKLLPESTIKSLRDALPGIKKATTAHVERAPLIPSANDHLSGRNYTKHPGNVLFRTIIAGSAAEYAAQMTNPEKNIVLDKIVREWPGKFLEMDKQTNCWNELSDAKVRDKIRDALLEKNRAKARARQQIPENIPTSHSTLDDISIEASQASAEARKARQADYVAFQTSLEAPSSAKVAAAMAAKATCKIEKAEARLAEASRKSEEVVTEAKPAAAEANRKFEEAKRTAEVLRLAKRKAEGGNKAKRKATKKIRDNNSGR